jgi:glutathione S-transferase
VQDSAEIAKVLDAKYPSPSLHLDDPRVNAAIEAGSKFFQTFSLYIVSLVPSNLPERDAEYFHRTRQQFLGKPLSQITAETDVDALVTKGKADSGEFLALLEKEDGPFILGNTSQLYFFGPFLLVSSSDGLVSSLLRRSLSRVVFHLVCSFLSHPFLTTPHLAIV